MRAFSLTLPSEAAPTRPRRVARPRSWAGPGRLRCVAQDLARAAGWSAAAPGVGRSVRCASARQCPRVPAVPVWWGRDIGTWRCGDVRLVAGWVISG